MRTAVFVEVCRVTLFGKAQPVVGSFLIVVLGDSELYGGVGQAGVLLASFWEPQVLEGLPGEYHEGRHQLDY